MNQYSNINILTFTLGNELFAVNVNVVKEIVWLPAIVPVKEASPLTIGVFNLRGHIIPVMDLSIHFGNSHGYYSISDKVIILNVKSETSSPDLTTKLFPVGGDTTTSLPFTGKGSGYDGCLAEFGLIVNEVHDVTAIPVNAIETSPTPHLIAEELKAGEDIITLIDHLAIAEFANHQPELKEKLSAIHNLHFSFEDPIFHERSKTLMHPLEETDAGNLSFAVVSLYEEYFGVDLKVIKEFIDVQEVTPVPGTPAHVVGDINLRGEILTLIDIGGILNEPAGGKCTKAIVAQINELVAGITVNDVIEVININPSDIRPVPASVEALCQEYIMGEFPYHGKMLSILDLKKILTSRKIVVEA